MIPLPEYPRPQLSRGPESWRCLNGTWQYAIRQGGLPKEERVKAPVMQGDILVPYSPETRLSGVQRQLLPDEVLWYRKILTAGDLPPLHENGRLLLHFGAVDQTCRIYANGAHIGGNQGGYFPFTVELTSYAKEKAIEILLAVVDPSDRGALARGKQTLKPGGIWYQATSGIWQSVWLEAVPEVFIRDVRVTPDLPGESVRLEVELSGLPPPGGGAAALPPGLSLSGEVFSPGQAGQTQGGSALCPLAEEEPGSLRLVARLLHPRPWSPEDPYLYTYALRLGEDRVEGYFAMRSFGVGKDHQGVPRLTLNGKPYTQVGVLDQGYWKGGAYTPPSDEMMSRDIREMKDLGFNMLRKHIKIEPMRWYYHCDRLGMLVWQDLVSGGGPYGKLLVQILPVLGLMLPDRKLKGLGRAGAAARESYHREWAQTIAHLYSVPSLALWVPFNEGWGQFDAARYALLTRKADPTRPVDHASGWHDQGAGDLKSRHIYFSRCTIGPDRKGRPAALTEFGGYSHALPGHEPPGKPFGYKRFDELESYQQAVLRLMEGLLKEGRNIAAFIYTQLSDVEQEVNGLLTEDRQASKWPKGSPAAEKLLKVNLSLRALGRKEG